MMLEVFSNLDGSVILQVGTVVLGQWLDLIFEVFSILNESMNVHRC